MIKTVCRIGIALVLLVAAGAFAGCRTRSKSVGIPVASYPLYLSSNATLGIERAIEDFFGDLDRTSSALNSAVAQQEVVIVDDIDPVKIRMMERLPQIDALKLAGVLGENSRGYLQVRALNPAAALLVADENADRKAAYGAISAKQGEPPAEVGRARARQIAEKAAFGIWLQAPDGTWHRKEP